MTAEFVKPGMYYKSSYVEALREGFRSLLPAAERIAWIDANFEAFLEEEEDLSSRPEWWQVSASPVKLRDGTIVKRVPCTTLWLVLGDRFIGEVAIRHFLTIELSQVGGHIGYNVRKSERMKGYGRLLLKGGLQEANRLGINPALITCNDDNLDSIRIIEGAGGRLENKIAIPGRPALQRRYWVATGK